MVDNITREDSTRRVAFVRFETYVSPREMAMVFACLPSDAVLVRADFAVDAVEHLFIFRSSRFKIVPVGERPSEILPEWEWEYSDDGNSRKISGVKVEWPIQVEFPGLKRAE